MLDGHEWKTRSLAPCRTRNWLRNSAGTPRPWRGGTGTRDRAWQDTVARPAAALSYRGAFHQHGRRPSMPPPEPATRPASCSMCGCPPPATWIARHANSSTEIDCVRRERRCRKIQGAPGVPAAATRPSGMPSLRQERERLKYRRELRRVTARSTPIRGRSRLCWTKRYAVPMGKCGDAALRRCSSIGMTIASRAGIPCRAHVDSIPMLPALGRPKFTLTIGDLNQASRRSRAGGRVDILNDAWARGPASRETTNLSPWALDQRSSAWTALPARERRPSAVLCLPLGRGLLEPPWFGSLFYFVPPPLLFSLGGQDRLRAFFRCRTRLLGDSQ